MIFYHCPCIVVTLIFFGFVHVSYSFRRCAWSNVLSLLWRGPVSNTVEWQPMPLHSCCDIPTYITTATFKSYSGQCHWWEIKLLLRLYLSILEHFWKEFSELYCYRKIMNQSLLSYQRCAMISNINNSSFPPSFDMPLKNLQCTTLSSPIFKLAHVRVSVFGIRTSTCYYGECMVRTRTTTPHHHRHSRIGIEILSHPFLLLLYVPRTRCFAAAMLLGQLFRPCNVLIRMGEKNNRIRH